jgi:putative restriction endonuclease
MTPEDIKSGFNNVTVWRCSGERATHKPLLALYAIARLLRCEPRMIPYDEIDRELGKLLMEFGPRRQSYHPEYPFWRLQNDGIWEVSSKKGLTSRSSNTDAKKSELLEHNVHGGFLPQIYDRLSQDKQLVREIVQDLLNANFPESIHQDILDAVGIEFAVETRIVVARSPDFRERILRAYEYSCAICGFDVRLGSIPVALEAAWHQAGGPDEERNELALCTLHHKLFDRGVFTLSNSMSVIVSESANGTRGFQEWVFTFHGKAIRRPQRPAYSGGNLGTARCSVSLNQAHYVRSALRSSLLGSWVIQ